MTVGVRMKRLERSESKSQNLLARSKLKLKKNTTTRSTRRMKKEFKMLLISILTSKSMTKYKTEKAI